MCEPWIFGVMLLYLIVLSIYDWKIQKVPVYLLAAGVLAILLLSVYKIRMQDISFMQLILGLIPGSLLILVAWITGKAGYADGIAMLILGVIIGYRNGILILCMSLLILAVVSIVLLFFHKVKKNTKLPYLPFLTITLFIQQIALGGIV